MVVSKHTTLNIIALRARLWMQLPLVPKIYGLTTRIKTFVTDTRLHYFVSCGLTPFVLAVCWWVLLWGPATETYSSTNSPISGPYPFINALSSSSPSSTLCLKSSWSIVEFLLSSLLTEELGWILRSFASGFALASTYSCSSWNQGSLEVVSSVELSSIAALKIRLMQVKVQLVPSPVILLLWRAILSIPMKVY